MAKKKQKYYVVWRGREPGVYDTWAECQAQISGFSGPEFKSFSRREEALEAFRGNYSDYRGSDTKTYRLSSDELKAAGVVMDSVSVDAACAGNPGPVEYRGVDTETGAQFFHQGPYAEGTINIGEFLAIVHALAWLKRENRTCPVYSDSRIAISWVKRTVVRTKCPQTTANRRLFVLADRALQWLRDNTFENSILKWETKKWGENPADFGRK